ncbi:MAG: helix-turn-helix domain-containing protein [Lachnospiraceae bacterium]
MTEKSFYSYTYCYDNTVCDVAVYTFSSAISFEFYEQNSADNGEHRHSGQYYFRVDFTQIGRYECEFSDHTFSYRGENDITLLATPTSKDWCLTSSYPTGGYRGCAFIIRLDTLTEQDNALFHRFGICIDKLVAELSASKRWCKITSPHLANIFHDIYSAHEIMNREMVLLKSLEVLVNISQNHSGRLTDHVSAEFFPAVQVNKVKRIHDHISRYYARSLSFEKLAKEQKLNYSIFNMIFKKMYGDSPYQYLKKIRINEAAQRILDTNLSITEIALLVGYANPSKFSSAFKSVMGVLPHDFRK